MKKIWHRLREGYVRFAERQGFAVIVTVCVGVITATALWTNQQEEAWAAPTPPVSQDVSAAQLVQQSLKDASTPAPAPTEAPRCWIAPLADPEVLRPFDDSAMVQSGVTGIWHIHDAVDLRADPGAKVLAMADGTIVAAGEDQLQGVWLLIDHGDGFASAYLHLTHYIVSVGEYVSQGQVIGYMGSTGVSTGPHLHFTIYYNGDTVNPAEYIDFY